MHDFTLKELVWSFPLTSEDYPYLIHTHFELHQWRLDDFVDLLGSRTCSHSSQYLALALACKDFKQHRQDLDNLTQQQDVKMYPESSETETLDHSNFGTYY